MLCTNRMGRLLERPKDSELQMGEADRKRQREMSRKFRFEVTILLCQVSEGLVDSEKSCWVGLKLIPWGASKNSSISAICVVRPSK